MMRVILNFFWNVGFLPPSVICIQPGNTNIVKCKFFPNNFCAIATSKATSFGWAHPIIPLCYCQYYIVDPIAPLCAVAKEYGVWVHINAAYAGSACICPKFRYFIDGVEDANSFSLNAHKWFFTTLDCCCLWVKDPSALVKALSTSPEYLRNKATESKQLWMVLRGYGVANLRNFLRTHVKMAKHFEEKVTMDKRFEIVVLRNFTMVCFRLLPPPVKDPEDETLRQSFAVGATLTEDRHVNLAWKVVQEHLGAILKAC
uniref:Tyrosine decarboxylase 1-like n=1 Tax=Nelumbo nucifera TaxID=4432 RepID=A0A822XIW5_NELNU|nr:TPA_asm: hypothetical protein HUJ06_022917 [Nelumbo nucifera]